MRVSALTLSLLLFAAASRPAAAADATPSAPGLPNFVQLVSISGLPSDSLVRGQFMAGFRGEFAGDEVQAERQSGSGAWEPSAPVSNRFKWLEGDDAADAWQLQVVIGSPPAIIVKPRTVTEHRRALESHRRSRGMIAALTVQAPDPGSGPPPPVQARFAFMFPAAAGAIDAGQAPAMPGVGYLYPWNEAGRVVARLALDMLHHQRGDMDAGERLVIAPALRADAGR